MKKSEDRNTRYFVDLDLDTHAILGWDYARKDTITVRLKNPYHYRLFISKGQYNKLEKQSQEVKDRLARNA